MSEALQARRSGRLSVGKTHDWSAEFCDKLEDVEIIGRKSGCLSTTQENGSKVEQPKRVALSTKTLNRNLADQSKLPTKESILTESELEILKKLTTHSEMIGTVRGLQPKKVPSNEPNKYFPKTVTATASSNRTASKGPSSHSVTSTASKGPSSHSVTSTASKVPSSQSATSKGPSSHNKPSSDRIGPVATTTPKKKPFYSSNGTMTATTVTPSRTAVVARKDTTEIEPRTVVPTPTTVAKTEEPKVMPRVFIDPASVSMDSLRQSIATLRASQATKPRVFQDQAIEPPMTTPFVSVFTPFSAKLAEMPKYEEHQTFLDVDAADDDDDETAEATDEIPNPVSDVTVESAPEQPTATDALSQELAAVEVDEAVLEEPTKTQVAEPEATAEAVESVTFSKELVELVRSGELASLTCVQLDKYIKQYDLAKGRLKADKIEVLETAVNATLQK